MVSAGIDIGSRTIKLALVENGVVVFARVWENSYDPIAVCRKIFSGIPYDHITATGYGRHLFTRYFDGKTISEIKAFAIGMRHIRPACRTILDIGGQDTKAIAIDTSGGIGKFEMNDRCAAGTGRFLEVMASALGYSMGDFVKAGLSAAKAEKINSMCTVFAETEIVSLIARGADRANVALGIHRSIVGRAVSMLKKIPMEDEIAFVGGVAMNACVAKLLEAELGKKVYVPDNPQAVGAVGCAFSGEISYRYDPAGAEH